MATPPLSLVDFGSAVRRGDTLAPPVHDGVPTGHALLDAALPGSGWPTGEITELMPVRPGIGELSLWLPTLARLGASPSTARRWIAWVVARDTPWQLYPPALQGAGIDLSSMLLIETHSTAESLWALRQLLSSNTCSAVFGWLADADFAALRRLQLAAAEGDSIVALFRPAAEAVRSSPAALRLRLAPTARGLSIELLKRRGPPLAAPIYIDLGRRTSAASADDSASAPCKVLARAAGD